MGYLRLLYPDNTDLVGVRHHVAFASARMVVLAHVWQRRGTGRRVQVSHLTTPGRAPRLG